MKQLPLLISMLWVCTVIPATLLAAEDPEVDPVFSMSLEDLMDAPIIGSTHTEESLISVPSSATVYNYDEIEKMGVKNLEELMNYVPGFSSRRSSDSGYTYTPTVRGKRSTTSGKEILVLMDGQRLNSDFSGGTFVANHLIPLGNVERVEFLRGSTSSLYGSNAFMGVINIITTKDRNKVGMSAGTDNAYDPYVNYSYRKDDFGISAYGMISSYGGEDYQNLYNPISARTDTSDPFERKEIYLNGNYKRLNIIANYHTIDESKFYALGNIADQQNLRDVDSGFFRISYDGTGQTMFNTKVSGGYIIEDSDWNFQFSPGGIYATNPAPLLLQTTITTKELSLDIINTVNVDQDNLVFGAEYRRPETDTAQAGFNGAVNNFSDPRKNIYYDGAYQYVAVSQEDAREIYALFGQYQYHFAENFVLTAGLRFDHYSDFGNATSPRLGLVYNTHAANRALKLLYSEAFRAPARDERDVVNNPVLIGNPDLQPEIAKTIEGIWIERFASTSLTTTLFYTRIDDVIGDGFITTPTGQQRTWANVRSDTFSGLEFEVLSDIGSDFFIRGGLSLVTQQPDELFRYVEETASLAINWNPNRWNINLSGIYQGSSGNAFGSNDNVTELDGYIIINSKVAYQWNKGLSLYVQATNLFNEEYLTPTEDVSNPDGIPGQGQRFFAGIDFSF